MILKIFSRIISIRIRVFLLTEKKKKLHRVRHREDISEGT